MTPAHVYRLTIAYRGAAYGGWQRQPNATTVQGVIESALADLLEAPTAVVGAGRTDAGVHARGQVAHVALARPFAPRGLVHGVNHRLPRDVRVLAAATSAPTFHARFDARAKVYRYRWHRARVLDPRAAEISQRVAPDLDLDAVRRAARALVGQHDFGAFALAGGSHTTSVRRLYAATVDADPSVDGARADPDDRGAVRLTFIGEGFLRGMVRGLAGTLLEVGAGRRAADDVGALLRPGTPRAAAGPTAPAHGLTLERVIYPIAR
ncbi:MAG: tRNA pseudouridine(38-40) synthase TruA [Acidobacteriota bacterium]